MHEEFNKEIEEKTQKGGTEESVKDEKSDKKEKGDDEQEDVGAKDHLQGHNESLIRQSCLVLLRRPLLTSCSYTLGGFVGAAIVGPHGGFLFHTTLHLQAIVILGPLGAAHGLLSATRQVVVTSGWTQRLGRDIYDRALSVVQDDEAPSQTIPQALDHLRASNPMANSILTGDGWLGWTVQTALGIFLPTIGQVVDQIEQAIDWSEQHDQELVDRDIIARATTGFVETYLQDTERWIQSTGTLLYAAIATVSFTLSVGVSSLFSGE